MGLISNFFAPSGGPRWLRRIGEGAPYLWRFAFLVGIYAIAARLSLTFAVIPGIASPLWLPSAIGLCACLTWGVRITPAIGPGVVLGFLPMALPPAAVLVIACGSMLEAIAASALVQRLYQTRTDFIYRGTAFRFIVVALASSMIGASAGTLGIAIANHVTTDTLDVSWLTWWLGDATGMIVGVPLILAWNIAAGIEWRPKKILEIAAFALLLAVVAQFSFGGAVGKWPIAYLVFPFFLWAAIRFNLAAVTWTTVFVCAVAVWNTAHGNGPFASADPHTSLLLLAIYISVIGSMGLVVANLVYQRSSAESLLREERDGREQYVLIRTHTLISDLEERKRIEASLREAEERYRKVVELSPDAIFVQQEGVFVYANPAAVRMLKAERVEDIVGKSLFDFLHPDFHALARQRIADLQRGHTLNAVEEAFFRLDGSAVDVEVNSSPFLHKGKFASLFILRDITERKKSIEQMAYLAHYDSLTGLPNRTLFHLRLEHALTIAERPGRSLEILFLDLDRFKNINDTLGHAAGDIVLKEAASRLQSILRESDTVARLGGDEFVVLIENVDEPHRGGVIAEKILAAFAPPFMLDKEPFAVSASIGISSFPSDGTDAETLLKKADIAMYRAKEMGRSSYCYFSEEMNLHATERLALESALTRAVDLGQFSLHYQPKIDILTNRITGMEALLRWNHPSMGSVPPQRFLPAAEESNLIRPIGYWVIRTACAQNRQWQLASPVRLRVAVNLSARQLADTRLLDNIDAILADTELDPKYLELEVSESAVMVDPERTIGVLNKLRDRGISIAIDDFGVGNSSLAYLKRFPIRAVKIDRSFVQGIPFNQDDSAITKAIINLAHSLECSVIAEGAETQQQFDFLRDNDCDTVQGFYFSAPMSAEHFEDLIRVQSNLHLH